MLSLGRMYLPHLLLLLWRQPTSLEEIFEIESKVKKQEREFHIEN